MDFTIVTPSFNGGEFIRECLESVKNQEGVSLEHIILDNFSTDNTAEVVSEFPHVTFIQQKDSGMSEAINKGFLRAKGDWVIWLNTDDRFLPGALKRVLDFTEQYEDIDIIHCAWNFIDKEGKHLRRMNALPLKKFILVQQGCYIASTGLFLRRKTTIQEDFLVNEEFRYIMDGEYYVRLLSAGKKFQNFNYPVADFRLHENALSARNNLDRSMKAHLKRERQFAEAQAIRRAYGITLFCHTNWNIIVDGILYDLARVYKLFLLLMTSKIN